MSAGDGISAVLTYAILTAISPVAIIAAILMLFSSRARVNGPMFVAGWVLSLAAVSGVAYALADAGNLASDSTADDAVSWGKIAFGVLLLLVAARKWRSRPAPGAEPETPKWMAGIDAFSAGKRSRSASSRERHRRTSCSRRPPAWPWSSSGFRRPTRSYPSSSTSSSAP